MVTMRNDYDRKWTRTRAGRRSVGFGSEVTTRPEAHVVGVRVDGRGAVWLTVVHCWVLTGVKGRKIRVEKVGGFLGHWG